MLVTFTFQRLGDLDSDLFRDSDLGLDLLKYDFRSNAVPFLDIYQHLW